MYHSETKMGEANDKIEALTYSLSRALRKLGCGAQAPFLRVSWAAARPDAPFLTAPELTLNRRLLRARSCPLRQRDGHRVTH